MGWWHHKALLERHDLVFFIFCHGLLSKMAQGLQRLWEGWHVSPRTAPFEGLSCARITIGLAGLVICDLSPTMTCQWASASSGPWCNSDLDPMLCPLSRAGLSGRPSRATFAGALSVIHKLWAMNSMLCLIAPISARSGPSFLAFSRMLQGACVCSCGTRTKNLSAIVSLPCCKRLRHEHDPVLISQAG